MSDKIGMAVTRERVWRKFRIDHVRVPGHHQLEKKRHFEFDLTRSKPAEH
jgi:hypothetical protein